MMVHSSTGKLVLASRSPRRRALLEALGCVLEVRLPDLDESPEPGESAVDLVQRLAEAKAASVPATELEVVVAADSVVVTDGEIIGKPRDDQDARDILGRLSGRAHDVLTGFCVRRGQRVRSGVVTSSVRFRLLSSEEIDAYVSSGEPRDKAGAYGIQGGGAALVESVRGSYSNVVGLPVTEVVEAIRFLAGFPGSRTPGALPEGE